MRFFLPLALLPALLAAPPSLDSAHRQALDHITAGRLRAHLAFLASDLLEGRVTPSRGLDVAAEYIAAQFTIAGLQPGGDGGTYFQTERRTVTEQSLDTLEIAIGEAKFGPAALAQTAGAIPALDGVPACKLAFPSGEEERRAAARAAHGKVVLVELPEFRPGQGFAGSMAATGQFLEAMQEEGVPLVIAVSRGRAALGRGSRLGDSRDSPPRAPVLASTDSALRDLFAKLPDGPLDERVTVRVPAAVERQVDLRNVAGVLPGSDPTLQGSYLLVTAHYDHLGVRPAGEGDRIYNGANDDASGTVSAIEIAAALATLPVHPRRSIVFVALYGEEIGGLGGRYYVRHPRFPLADTIADVNLEHMGRSDAPEGDRSGSATLTGFDYSTVPAAFVEAGKLTGIEVYKDAKNSDPYFSRSDNQTFATAGVPAHTLCVAFLFPDYHAVGDEWQKIDYANMAKVDRMAALALAMLADSDEPPHWNESESRARRYAEAATKLRQGGTLKDSAAPLR